MLEKSNLMRIAVLGLAGVALLFLVLGRNQGDDGQPYGSVGQISRFVTSSNLCLNEDGGCQAVDQARSFFMGNMMQTNDTGKMQAILIDQTELTIGPNTELVVTEYLFDTDGQGRLEAKLFRGAARLFTGQIGDLEDKEVTVAMPVGQVGLRGTDVWIGEIDGAFSVLLMDGNVLVSTDAGSVVLDTPGQGVALPGRDQPPGAIKNWPEEKKKRALDLVNF